jgi:DNA-directed RNA polymerase specialized sigma24 family protein
MTDVMAERPPKTKENEKIIKMKDEENMSFTDIGDELDISRQRAHQRYHDHK